MLATTSSKIDESKSIKNSNERYFTEAEITSLTTPHQNRFDEIKLSLGDAAIHFSPPLKDRLNTDFADLNHICALDFKCISRQSLIGQFSSEITFLIC